MKRTLVSFDIASIKQYVFGTDRLREIRGASALLDQLNRFDLPEFARQVDPGSKVVFCGGGTGLLEVSEDKALDVRKRLQKEFVQATVSGRLNTAHVDVPEGPGANIGDLYRTLSARLRVEKLTTPEFVTEPTHPLLLPCSVCGEMYATVWRRGFDDEDRALCISCNNKHEHDDLSRRELGVGRWPGFWGQVVQAAGEHGVELAGCQRPEDLGRLLSRTGEIALLYADGDSLGRLLEEAQDLNDLGRRSQAVEASLLSALGEAISGPLRPPPGGLLPFDIFLLGGDDLVLATSAENAFETARTLVKGFREASAKRLGQPASLSVGLALAHARYPFRHMLDLSEGALRQAKRERFLAQSEGRFPQDGPGWISYIRISNSSFLSFEDYESKEFRGELSGKPARRGLRPFTLESLDRARSAARKLAGLPRAKLEHLRSTAWLERTSSTLRGLRVLSRLSEGHRSLVKEALYEVSAGGPVAFPWFEAGEETVNPWGDLLDLLDLAVGKPGRKERK